MQHFSKVASPLSTDRKRSNDRRDRADQHRHVVVAHRAAEGDPQSTEPDRDRRWTNRHGKNTALAKQPCGGKTTRIVADYDGYDRSDARQYLNTACRKFSSNADGERPKPLAPLGLMTNDADGLLHRRGHWWRNVGRIDVRPGEVNDGLAERRRPAHGAAGNALDEPLLTA